MNNNQKTTIKVDVLVEVPVAAVWKVWTTPEEIVKWNNASDDWHTPFAESDLRPGGKFLSRMEARDGSNGFDFWGIYDRIIPEKLIEYTLGDKRKVQITFEGTGPNTRVTEVFEAESENTIELQQFGWQAILNNFKKVAESGLK